MSKPDLGLPHNYKLQFSKSQISDAVLRLAPEISTWTSAVLEKEDTEVLAIPVLRGGLFFFADLARCISSPLEVLPGRTHSYQLNQNGVFLDEIKISLESSSLKNRSILLIDDICDSGKTLKALTKYILDHGANQVKSAVLIQREIKGEKFMPDWRCFSYSGEEWFVGYGMEDKNRWSNLPDIYIIT